MDTTQCAHRDVRKFDEFLCCLECGETLHHPGRLGRHQDDPTRFTHDYDRLRLQSGREIRLVALLPGAHADPINITIIVVDLRDDPEYEAISYTWATEDGRTDKIGRVHSPDGIINVTENCEAVLRQVRLLSAPRLVWIDAICIDQSCVLERNHQVGLMEMIYRQASHVLLSINDPTSDFSNIMSFLKRDRRWGIPMSILPTSEEVSTNARKLLSCRYFSRVWVIQEFAFARKIILHVNDGCVYWSEAIREALRIYCGDAVPKFLERRIGAKLNMSQCLALSMNSSESDPRDIVYGIASFLSPDTRMFISIDYALSYEEVLAKAVQVCIVEQGDLHILSLARLQEEEDEEIACTFGLEELRHYIRDIKNVWTGKGTLFVKSREELEVWIVGQWKTNIRVKTVPQLHMYEGGIDWLMCSGNRSIVSIGCGDPLPPKQILPRLQVWAQFIDVSHGHVEHADMSQYDQADDCTMARDIVWHQATFSANKNEQTIRTCKACAATNGTSIV